MRTEAEEERRGRFRQPFFALRTQPFPEGIEEVGREESCMTIGVILFGLVFYKNYKQMV